MPDRQRTDLRVRLAAYSVLVLLLPLGLAVSLQQVHVRQELRQRAVAELTARQQAAIAVLSAQRARAADVADDLAEEIVLDPLGAALVEGDAARAQELLDARAARLVPARADLVAVLGPQADVLAVRGRDPAFADASPETVAAATAPEAIAAAVRGEDVVPGALLEVRELTAAEPGGPLGWVVALRWLDDAVLGEAAVAGPTALVRGEEVLAASGVSPMSVPTERPLGPGELAVVRVDGREVVLTSSPLLAEADEAAPELLAWTERGEALPPAGLALLVVLPAFALTALVGALLGPVLVTPRPRGRVRRQRAAALGGHAGGA